MAGLILAVETSCDDTCAAVLDGPRILANLISSQHAAHARFGGVVPEVASRHHLELTAPLVEVHLSNPATRESFRHTSVVARVADGTVAGFGLHSYELALRAVATLLAQRP